MRAVKTRACRTALPFDIRLAQNGDVEALTRLHKAVFTPKEHLLLVFGNSVLRSVYRWFINSPETFTMVAASGNDIVGLCTACSQPYNWPMFRNNWLAFVFGALGHPQALLHPELRTRARLVFAPKRKTRSDQPVNHVALAQLGFLAVRQDCRGTGLPESLLLRTITECKKRKWPRLGAGVYRTNLPARFMYAKLGFQENKSRGTDHLVFVELDLNKYDLGS